jgi:hypothetical protein
MEQASSFSILIDENDTVGVAVDKLRPFPSEFDWARLQYDPVSPNAPETTVYLITLQKV